MDDAKIFSADSCTPPRPPAAIIAPLHGASTSLPWYAAARAAAGYGASCSEAQTTIHGAIAAASAARPDAPAMLTLDACGGPARVVLSHAQLQAAAATLSAALASAAGPAEMRGGATLRVAAVLLDGTPARLVAYLAVLRAGLAYAPLEAAHPPAALHAALRVAAPRVLITSRALLPAAAHARCATFVLDDDTSAILEASAARGDWAESESSLPAEAGAVAHVSFTSGSSTGVPRLLACGHGGSLLSHAWRAALCPHAEDDVTASAAFGIWDAAAALLAGGAVAPLRDATVRDGGALARALLRCGATRLMLTPSLAAALLADATSPPALRRLRLLTLCGEPAGAPLLAALRAALHPDAVLLNLYSTAEAHDVAAERITAAIADDDVTCGFVAPFAAVHVLKPSSPDGSPDERRELCAVGELGEVWLGGAALADGHVSGSCVVSSTEGGGFRTLRVAGLASAAAGGERLFSTGDVGSLRADGRLQVAGRAAGVAKLKLAGGTTADAAAIETALMSRCAVAAAAVAVRDGTLAAFLVARDDAAVLPSARDVRAMLRGAVPDAALPQRVVWLQRLPLGPTGKLDRAALAWPPSEYVDVVPATEAAHAAPDELATALALFATAAARAGAPPLSTARGAATHFLLDAGGTSVAAAAMLGAAVANDGDATLPPLSLAAFLAEPTAGALAALLRQRRDKTGAAAAAPEADAAEGKAALRDAEDTPLEVEPLAQRCGLRDAIVLTGAAGAVGAHTLAALTSQLASSHLRDAPQVFIVCLVRAADDAAAASLLRAAAERHGLPDPLMTAGVRVEAVCADLAAPHLGLADAAAFAALAARTRVVVHAAGRVSLAAPYAGWLRDDNVVSAAGVLRLALTARAAAHLVSSSAALSSDGDADVAAPPAAAPPGGGGYARAKWAAERLAVRAATSASSRVPVTLHRVGYIACPEDATSSAALPPDAQGIVLAACAALCAAPDAPRWRLAWASLPRVAAALAAAALADAERDSILPADGLRVVHHGAEAVPLATALAALAARGLPAAPLPPAAWARAVRCAAREPGACEALRHAAALLDAVGLEAALGAQDVLLRPSAWPPGAAQDAAAEAPPAGEGARLLAGVLDALATQRMLPGAR
jgi:thioester reductase-like protein/non-ribosomal peptide synthetase component F